MTLDKSREGLGLGLFVILSLVCLGLVVWHEITDGETVGGLATSTAVLERMAAVLVTLSLSIYAIVEGAAMLYEKYAKRRFQEGKEEGKQEGREEGKEEGREEGKQEGREEGIQVGLVEADREWSVWLQRRDEALADGRPFDEPSPAERGRSNGQ